MSFPIFIDHKGKVKIKDNSSQNTLNLKHFRPKALGIPYLEKEWRNNLFGEDLVQFWSLTCWDLTVNFPNWDKLTSMSNLGTGGPHAS